jgi:hypothetical protein
MKKEEEVEKLEEEVVTLRSKIIKLNTTRRSEGPRQHRIFPFPRPEEL